MSEIKVTVDVNAMRQQIGDQMMALIFAFAERASALSPKPGTPSEVLLQDPEIHKIVKAYCRKIEVMERITPNAPPYKDEYDGKTAEDLLKVLVVRTINFAGIKDKQTSGIWILSVWHAVMPTLKQRLIEEGYMRRPEAET